MKRPTLLRSLLSLLSVILLLTAVGPLGAETVSRITVVSEPDSRIPAEGYGPGFMSSLTIAVPANLTITDLDVYLDIQHSNVADLMIDLTAPTGMAVRLKDVWLPNWRDPQVNLSGTVFDDDAAGYLPDGLPPYSDLFRPPPGHELAQFNGTPCVGLWTLRIYDYYHGDVGRLNRCELRFTGTHAPEPTTGTLLLFALPIFTRLRRHLSPRQSDAGS